VENMTLETIKRDDLDLSAWTEDDHYEAARQVSAGMREVEEAVQWFYGRVAASLDTKWGDHTIERLAGAIGKDRKTVESYRRTYLAWQDSGKLAPGRRQLPKSWGAARVLSSQEDRFALIEANPDMTSTEAEELVRSRQPVRVAKPIKSGTPDTGSPTSSGLSNREQRAMTKNRIKNIAESIDGFAGFWDSDDCATLLDALEIPLAKLRAKANERNYE
jgi:hypothetical protein